ncbi:MAG: extracellular solute-binding protein [Micromonosporaceae bacterium]|nr:extracellular solute-binding protein [Micromonosporaceae bacterium]
MPSRRNALGVLWTAVALPLVASCGAPGAGRSDSDDDAPVPLKPAQPVSLSILDVAGNLQLTQPMIDSFVSASPSIISKVTYSKAPSPELAGKIKAQQDANRVDIDIVLTGVDGLAAGIEQGLWLPLLPQQADRLPGMGGYLPGAQAMQQLASGQGVVVTYYPSGPLIEYLPDKVPSPPTTAQELLDYARVNPGAVQYARPSNSGPGRTFLMGLPYLLGDADPKNPTTGWEKTWSYLAELDRHVTLYPSGTTETMKNLANGSAKIILTTTGWDINPRVLGTVPKEARVAALQGFHWVTDAHYVTIPRGVSADRQAAVLALVQWMLQPDQQAKAYDSGYFYPGPAIRDVDLSMAPEASRTALEEYGRPEYAALIADHPVETPLDAKALVAAFDRWDREIGGAKANR